MKLLSAGTSAKVSTRMGTEPLIVVKVTWTTGARFYSERTIEGVAEGQIVTFSSIQGNLNEKSFGQIQSASISLIDTDGGLKDLFDSTVVEQRPVVVYHYYPFEEMVPVLIGKVCSPIEWSEGNRLLKFEINAEIDSDDLLIEVKEPDDYFKSEDDVGKVLPLCFGSVLHVPAIELSLGPIGKLTSLISSITTWFTRDGDPASSKVTFNTTTFHVTKLDNYFGQLITLDIGGTLFYGAFNNANDKTEFACAGLGSFNVGHPITANVAITSRDASDQDHDNANCIFGSCDTNLAGKYLLIDYKRTYYYVKNGKSKNKASEAAKTSKLQREDGTDFSCDEETVSEKFVAQVSNHDKRMGKIYLNRPVTDRYGDALLLSDNTTASTISAEIINIKGHTDYDWDQLPNDGDPRFWQINTGTKVRIYSIGSTHIINSVATDVIHEVLARRQGTLQAVPKSYYTTELAKAITINDKAEVITTVTFKESLSQRPEESWDGDQIYVSLTSSVGNNLVNDIIPWIVAHRVPGLTITDPNHVGNTIVKYPSNFAVLGQSDALKAIQGFAWQARVGVYIDAGIMTFKYLAKEPTESVYQCTIDKIKSKSLVLKKTETDNAHPKITFTWKKTYTDEDDEINKIILEKNKLLYKKRDLELNLPIYNQASCARKSAEFWSARISNIWLHASVDTFLTSLAVQIWDTVEIVCPFVNGGTAIKGMVDGIDFDTDKNSITLQVWLPICKGTGSAYQLDDSDVVPPSPVIGLAQKDYTIPLNIPRTVMTRSVKLKTKTYTNILDRETAQ